MKNKFLFIAFLLVAIKICLVLGWWGTKPHTGAIAQDIDVTLTSEMMKDANFVMAIRKKQAELEEKEAHLKKEEERLTALKTEILARIQELRQLEAKLAATLEAEKGEEGKRIKDLARVYEAMPPEKAAAMLAKLDVRTAAGITMNMKRDRAGAIWGYLDAQKAVEITREITRQKASAPEESPHTSAEPSGKKVPPARKKLPMAAQGKKAPTL
ncbi:MAG: hypothetical protein N2572_04660 [Syntrophales bacterium]|nr:hypothetical protein [Syntrophales bacterium]